MSGPTSPPPRPATALRNLQRIHVAAIFTSLGGFGAAMVGSMRLAVAAIVATLILNIISSEAIRVVLANMRGPGR